MSAGEVDTHGFRTGVAVGALLLIAGCSMGGGSGGAAGPGTAGPAGGAGMMGGYRFSALTCTAPAKLPGSTLDVVLGDAGMSRIAGGTAPMGSHMMLRARPASVPAGAVSLVAENMGWRTHELVVLPLEDGASAGRRTPGPDGKIDETGSLGEASKACGAGTGEGISAGSVGWVTMTLSPGRYELVCNLPNHYAGGMYQEIVVTG